MRAVTGRRLARGCTRSWRARCPQRLCGSDHCGGSYRAEVATVERRRIRRTEQEQLVRVEHPALPPKRQSTPEPIRPQRARHGHAVDENDAISYAYLLWRHRTDALKQWNAFGQIAPPRSQRGGVFRKPREDDAAHPQRVSWSHAVPAARHAVGRVVNDTRDRPMYGRPSESNQTKSS